MIPKYNSKNSVSTSKSNQTEKAQIACHRHSSTETLQWSVLPCPIYHATDWPSANTHIFVTSTYIASKFYGPTRLDTSPTFSLLARTNACGLSASCRTHATTIIYLAHQHTLIPAEPIISSAPLQTTPTPAYLRRHYLTCPSTAEYAS